MSTNTFASPTRALAWIREHHWAIEPQALQVIAEIAAREHEADLEALAAKAGQPLLGTRSVEMREGGVAVLSLIGPMFRYANLFTAISGATSLERAAQDLGKALADPRVSAIVLAIDSPGGEVSGVNEFARMVFDARTRKSIVAYISDRGASAAYWIASAAEQIVVDATASVGSVGVLARVITSQNKNVVEVVSRQSPYKRVDVTTDVGRDHIQRHVDRLAQVFVESVATFRGVDTETVLRNFGQGGILVGSDAVAAGMADRLGSLESTIAGLSGNPKETHQMMTLAASAAKISPERQLSPTRASTPASDAREIARQARAYQNEQKALGHQVDAATAVDHVLFAGSPNATPSSIAARARTYIDAQSLIGVDVSAAHAVDHVIRQA
jgi:ClpP class serine protease